MIHVPGIPEREAVVERFRMTPGLDLVVHADPNRRGFMWNWTRMLVAVARDVRERGASDEEWSVMLNDDLVPAASDWVEQMQAAQKHSPERILGMVHFGGIGQRAADKGAPYAVGPYTLWGGAVAIRNDLVEPLARWVLAVHQRTQYPHDDVLMCAYMKRIGERTAMTSRAIFDLTRGASLLGHNPPINYPYLTIADDGPGWDAEPNYVKSDRSVTADVKRLAEEEQ